MTPPETPGGPGALGDAGDFADDGRPPPQPLQLRSATSRYKGVHWHKRNAKWAAQIQHEGATQNLGGFDDGEDAAEAYTPNVLVGPTWTFPWTGRAQRSSCPEQIRCPRTVV